MRFSPFSVYSERTSSHREEETKRLFATLVDLDPLKVRFAHSTDWDVRVESPAQSLSTASAALGEASTGLVTLTRAYEESKALVRASSL